jgi:hypothetical protein
VHIRSDNGFLECIVGEIEGEKSLQRTKNFQNYYQVVLNEFYPRVAERKSR